MPELATHIYIPDCQIKPDVPTEHLRWAGQYIVDKFAGRENVTIINAGDFADMPSLSLYDKGTRAMEGRRYQDDIDAANEGFALLNQPLIDYNTRQTVAKHKQWWPRRVLTLGNHEYRIERATQHDPKLHGLLSMDSLNYRELGWEVYDFLEPVFIDGICYIHYLANPMTGRPWGGAALTRLKTAGFSFTMGHQQTLDYAIRYTRNSQGEVRSQHALVAGAFYAHDEEYKSYLGNNHWRGIIVKHEVTDGQYDPMFISMDFLRRRYGT